MVCGVRVDDSQAGGRGAASVCVCLRVCANNNTMEEEQIWAGAGCLAALAQRVAAAGSY